MEKGRGETFHSIITLSLSANSARIARLAFIFMTAEKNQGIARQALKKLIGGHTIQARIASQG
jgi:hypothetical protein